MTMNWIEQQLHNWKLTFIPVVYALPCSILCGPGGNGGGGGNTTPTPTNVSTGLGLGNFFSLFGGGAIQLNASSIDGIVFEILTFVLSLVGLVAISFIIIGGFRYLTSSGDQNNIMKARQTITTAVIGLLIVAFAFFLTFAIFKLLNVPICFGKGSSFSALFNNGAFNGGACK
jgi:hypothetical protein